MDDEIGVWDQWGNFIGKFRVGDGCALGLTVLIVGIALSIGYLFILMIIHGFKALSRGDWLKAGLLLAIPSFVALIILYAISTSVVSQVGVSQDVTATSTGESCYQDEVYKELCDFHLTVHNGKNEFIHVFPTGNSGYIYVTTCEGVMNDETIPANGTQGYDCTYRTDRPDLGLSIATGSPWDGTYKRIGVVWPKKE